MKFRSPTGYIGGKGNLVAKLLKYVPPHRVYVEAFGGGASLLFAKIPSPVEVYNDIDEDLVNFFRVLKDPEKFSRFYAKVVLTPYARSEYKYCVESWPECEDDIERTYRWFVAIRMSFSGAIRRGWSFNITKSRRGMAGAVSRWLSILEELPTIHERFRQVQVEQLDFREVIPKYDTVNTFFYLDPPYLLETRKATKLYNYEMTTEDHKDLVEILLGVKGMVMLSGYINKLYEELERRGWERKDFETICYAVGKTRYTNILGEGSARQKVPRIESIWLNPQLIERLSINLEFLDIKTLK